MKEDLYEQQERIQQYLTGGLSTEARLAFEEKLVSDATLRAELDWYRAFTQVGQHAHLFELQEKLQRLRKETPITPDLDSQAVETSLNDRPGRINWWWGGLLGACLLLILGVITWRSSGPDTELLGQLTKQYLVPFENVISYDADETTAVTLGMTAYERGDYQQATGQLQRATANNPEVRLYLGISQLLNGDTDGAIYVLDNLTKDENSVFVNTARFYLALAYLQQQQWGEAELLLLPLREDAQFSNASQRILDAM